MVTGRETLLSWAEHRRRLVLGAALTCAPFGSAQPSGPEVAQAHRARNGASILQDFVALLSIPLMAAV